MIPVTFNKDDLQNEKKGTMRAQDLASMVGLLYPKKVGVLDIFDNPVTITNVDLSTTGYVKLTFSKGYVCAYGRLIYVEQGELVTLPLPASTESGNIGITINLAESGANEVEWFMKSDTLTQTNLLNEPANGVCDIALYTYSANSTSFNLGAKIAQVIPSITDYLAGANFTTPSPSDNSGRIATTEFVQYLSAGSDIRIYSYTNQTSSRQINAYDIVLQKQISFGGFTGKLCIRTGTAYSTKTEFQVLLPFTYPFGVTASPFDVTMGEGMSYSNNDILMYDLVSNYFTVKKSNQNMGCRFTAIGLVPTNYSGS